MVIKPRPVVAVQVTSMSQVEFAIGIADAGPNADGHARGFIRVGDFREQFVLTLNYWSIQDYQLHWRDALQRLVNGAPAMGLMTWMNAPDSPGHFRAWILYREGELAYVQDQLYPWPDIQPKFDDEQLVEIGQRQTHTEEGERISEWSLPMTAVAAFLQRAWLADARGDSAYRPAT